MGGEAMGEVMEAYFKWLNLSRGSIYKSVILEWTKSERRENLMQSLAKDLAGAGRGGGDAQTIFTAIQQSNLDPN